jgi:hypothetical protein
MKKIFSWDLLITIVLSPLIFISIYDNFKGNTVNAFYNLALVFVLIFWGSKIKEG